MLSLRLLGGPSLCGNGSTLTGPATQRHRLALLALLASFRSRPQSRDKLVAWLWPERDVEHARNLLNQGVHALRRAIGEAGIISVQDELRLDPAAVACDVVAFEDAIAAGELERAIGLYTGPFLDGFHLPGASEFEHWADGERDRLRRSYARSLESLAEAAEERREWSSAVERWRGLLSEEPYNARVTLRLMRALDGAGDRAGALQQARLHTLLLQQEFEAGPDPDVVALADRLRTDPANGNDRKVAAWSPDTGSNAGPPHAGTSAPARVTTDQFASTADLAPALDEPPSASPSPGPPLPAVPRRRWVAPLRIGLLVLGTIGVLGVVARNLQTPPAPATQPTTIATIAVLPFTYRGSPEFSYLGEGLVDLLSVKLEGAPGLRPVDSRALLKFASREGDITDPQGGALVARRFGAGLFVLGSITDAGGRLGVSATIYDAGGRPRHSFEAMARGEEEIFNLADRLARQILAEVQDEPLQFARVAGQSTTSLPALKAYLEGEREGRAGRLETAEEAFRRAVELDTSFALAYYRLAGFNIWVPQAQEMVDRALRHSEGLGEHHRRHLLAMAALVRGDNTTVDQQLRLILAAHPDDAEAWGMLGGLTLHKGHLLGRAWVDAREPYERVLALDPGNAKSVWWLAAIAAKEGRLTDLDSLTDRLLRLNPLPYLASEAFGQRAVALGDTAGEARFVADLRTRPDPGAQWGGGIVTWTTGNLSAGRRLWRLITEPSRSVGFRAMAHATLAKIELTNGRWNAASAELEALAALDEAAALEHRAFYALTRFREAPRPELLALRDSLQRFDPSSARTEGDGLIAIHRELHPYLRLYLLGLLSARVRDEPAARRYAAELERVDRSSPFGRFAADKAQTIRSELAWIRGRQQEALTLLEGAQFWTNNSGVNQRGDSPFTNHFHERFARPELLYRLGREDEALPWYRSLAYDLLYTGPAELRLAQIYEHKGNRRRAIEHYSRFVELWRESDSELQPMVHQAQQALARLR